MRNIDPTLWSSLGLLASTGRRVEVEGRKPVDADLVLGAPVRRERLVVLATSAFNKNLALPGVLHSWYTEPAGVGHPFHIDDDHRTRSPGLGEPAGQVCERRSVDRRTHRTSP